MRAMSNPGATAMRLTTLAFAVSLTLLAAQGAHAQDARKSFTAQGASEAAACDVANKQARDWAKQGKSQGRARELTANPRERPSRI